MNPKNFNRLFFVPIQGASLSHSAAAEIFNKDESRTDWHDETLGSLEKKEIRQLDRLLSGSSCVR